MLCQLCGAPGGRASGLDAAHPARTGARAPALTAVQGIRLAIDHHPVAGWAQIELIDPAACATIELVHDLLARLAEARYAGLVAVTHAFRITQTTPIAHRSAARLLAAGVSLTRAHEPPSGAWPLRRQWLLEYFLAEVRTTASGRLVWDVISQRALLRFGQTSAADEGFVEEALTVTVPCSIHSGIYRTTLTCCSATLICTDGVKSRTWASVPMALR